MEPLRGDGSPPAPRYDLSAPLRRAWLAAATEIAPESSAVRALLEERLEKLGASAELTEAALLRAAEDAAQASLITGTTETARRLSKGLRRAVYEFLLAVDASGSAELEPAGSANAVPDAADISQVEEVVAVRPAIGRGRPELLWEELAPPPHTPAPETSGGPAGAASAAGATADSGGAGGLLWQPADGAATGGDEASIPPLTVIASPPSEHVASPDHHRPQFSVVEPAASLPKAPPDEPAAAPPPVVSIAPPPPPVPSRADEPAIAPSGDVEASLHIAPAAQETPPVREAPATKRLHDAASQAVPSYRAWADVLAAGGDEPIPIYLGDGLGYAPAEPQISDVVVDVEPWPDADKGSGDAGPPPIPSGRRAEAVVPPPAMTVVPAAAIPAPDEVPTEVVPGGAIVDLHATGWPSVGDIPSVDSHGSGGVAWAVIDTLIDMDPASAASVAGDVSATSAAAQGVVVELPAGLDAAVDGWPDVPTGLPVQPWGPPAATPIDPRWGPPVALDQPEPESGNGDVGGWSVRDPRGARPPDEQVVRRLHDAAIAAAVAAVDGPGGRRRRRDGDIVPSELGAAVDDLMRRRKAGDAATLLQRAAQEVGGGSIAELALDTGDQARAAGQSRAAIACYLAAWRADPIGEPALWRLADACVAERQIDAAVGYLERVADLLRARGDAKGASEAYSRVLTLVPARHDVRDLLRTAQVTGRFD